MLPNNYDHLPGADRERSRYREHPVLLGEALRGALGDKQGALFPFRSWAKSVRFEFPNDAGGFLQTCGSAAEAYFARPFASRPRVTFDGSKATHGKDTLELQVPVGRYRLDAVVCRSDFRLGVEIDGMQWHHRTAQQVAADYLRQRRIVCSGLTVIRFTAQEAFKDAGECWRQIDAILEANS